MGPSISQVRQLLAEALAEDAPVVIVRNNDMWTDYDIVKGFVVGLTRDWLVMQELANNVYVDGFGIYRIDRIEDVSPFMGPTGIAFLQRALSELGRPPVEFEIPPDAAIRDLMMMAADASTLIAVQMEDLEDEPSLFGTVVEFGATSFGFRYIEANGVWEDEATTWDYAHLTAVNFGTRYLAALRRFGDELPDARTS